MKNKKDRENKNNIYPKMIMQKALEIIEFGVETTGVFIDVFFSDYNTSYKKAKNFISKGTTNYYSPKNFEDKQRLYSLISRLKKQGFIKKVKNERSEYWQITTKGKEKLKQIRKSNTQSILPNYKKEKSDRMMVVVFDIPEKDRWKRKWLRTILISLDFSFLQQSVWVGQNRIPEEFIEDLNKRGMLSYVHIFEVVKKGTIDLV